MFEDREALFKFMLQRVGAESQASFLTEPRAFVKWFVDMNFPKRENVPLRWFKRR